MCIYVYSAARLKTLQGQRWVNPNPPAVCLQRMYISILLTIHSFHQSINQFIISLSFCIYLSINLSIYLPIYRSIDRSIYLMILPIYLSI